MKKILCIWEQGEDLGHISQFYPIIGELDKRDLKIVFAVRDYSGLGNFNWSTRVTFVQAPAWLGQVRTNMNGFADLLLEKGFDNAKGLSIIIEAWRQLLTAIAPDLIIFDHAPTALLAAKHLQVPKVIFSNPFLTPAPGAASPRLNPFNPNAESDIANTEQKILRVINQILEQVGQTPLTHFSQLYAADAYYLQGCRILDPYNDARSNAEFIRVNSAPSNLETAQWRSGSSPTLFAYLKFGRRNVDTTLKLLANLQARVCCYYAGATDETCTQFDHTSLVVKNRPFDFPKALSQTNTIVCHGGMGVVQASLEQGCPMILLPTQVEQWHTAVRIAKLGLGVMIQQADTANTIETKITEFFSNSSYWDRAAAFAEKLKQEDAMADEGNLVERVMGLLNT